MDLQPSPYPQITNWEGIWPCQPNTVPAKGSKRHQEKVVLCFLLFLDFDSIYWEATCRPLGPTYSNLLHHPLPRQLIQAKCSVCLCSVCYLINSQKISLSNQDNQNQNNNQATNNGGNKNGFHSNNNYHHNKNKYKWHRDDNANNDQNLSYWESSSNDQQGVDSNSKNTSTQYSKVSQQKEEHIKTLSISTDEQVVNKDPFLKKIQINNKIFDGRIDTGSSTCTITSSTALQVGAIVDLEPIKIVGYGKNGKNMVKTPQIAIGKTYLTILIDEVKATKVRLIVVPDAFQPEPIIIGKTFTDYTLHPIRRQFTNLQFFLFCRKAYRRIEGQAKSQFANRPVEN